MPGGYVHITLVAAVRDQLDRLPHFSNEDRYAVGAFFEFCQIGAVAPDYPYLDVGRSSSTAWADRMHYTTTAAPIRAGLRALRKMPAGDARARATAWLLGYAGHVGGDLTIHPIVERKVGAYHANKTGHRVCEMHQDSWAWHRRGMGNVGVADYFDGILHACSEGLDLHPDIAQLWGTMFAEAYGNACAQSPPDIHAWHRGFRRIMDIVEEGHALFAFARHTLADQGAVYPLHSDIDVGSYIENLETPEGRLHYDAIFERAVANIGGIWSTLMEALNAPDDLAAEAVLARVPDGNLDTGRDLGDETRYIYWGRT